MKKISIFILLIGTFLEANVLVKNHTTSDMLCVETYLDLYKMINGKRTLISKKEENISTLKPNQTIKRKRDGQIICYNKLAHINLYHNHKKPEISNEYTQKTFLANIKQFDITTYENKDRDFNDKNLGISQKCAPFQDGMYCENTYGLDVFYDKNSKIKKLIFYGNIVDTLEFKPKSIYKMKSSSIPLAFWVAEKYKKIFSKKPSLVTQNLILWENLTRYIKYVIITPQNGHYKLSNKIDGRYNFFQNGWNNLSKIPKDFIKTIEVHYR